MLHHKAPRKIPQPQTTITMYKPLYLAAMQKHGYAQADLVPSTIKALATFTEAFNGLTALYESLAAAGKDDKPGIQESIDTMQENVEALDKDLVRRIDKNATFKADAIRMTAARQASRQAAGKTTKPAATAPMPPAATAAPVNEPPAAPVVPAQPAATVAPSNEPPAQPAAPNTPAAADDKKSSGGLWAWVIGGVLIAGTAASCFIFGAPVDLRHLRPGGKH